MLIAPYHQRSQKQLALPVVLQTIDIIIHLNLLECAYGMNRFYNISYYLMLIP